MRTGMGRLVVAACVLGFTAVGCNAVVADAPPQAAVVRPYLEIARVLAADELAGVAAASDELRTAADPLKGKPGIDRILAAVDGVKATDIAAARRSFKGMSDGMIEYMRASPATQTGNIIVHCPMAFSNQGAAWVQPEGKVANPYYGATMLRCGDKIAWDAKLPPTAKLD